MNLWQMLMARRGLMDVAEAHERGGAGGGAPAGDNEQSIQDPGKQGEQKEQPKGDDDEYAGMTQEELLAELRKSKKAGADLLKENMKRKEKERTLADQLAQYGDIDPARARQLLEAEQAAETARREAEQAELERRGEFDAVKKQMIEAHQAELAQRDERYSALESENAALKAQLVEMTVGVSFSSSAFLRDKVLMTPAIGLAQIADVMPQVSAAMDKAQGNISSGDTVRIIFGVATILVAAFIAWSQVRKHQKGLV